MGMALSPGTVGMAALAGRVAEGWLPLPYPRSGGPGFPAQLLPTPGCEFGGGPPCRPRIKVLMVTPGPWQRVG